MNAGKYKTVFRIFLILVISQAAIADSARESTSQGNKLYNQGNYNEAINSYDQALLDAPGALEPKFNQANSYYRLDDLDKVEYRQRLFVKDRGIADEPLRFTVLGHYAELRSRQLDVAVLAVLGLVFSLFVLWHDYHPLRVCRLALSARAAASRPGSDRRSRTARRRCFVLRSG